MSRVTIINLRNVSKSIELSVLPRPLDVYPKYISSFVQSSFLVEEGKIGTIRILCNNISRHPLYEGVDPSLIALSEFRPEDPCNKLVAPHEIKNGSTLLLRIREPCQAPFTLRRITNHLFPASVYYVFQNREKTVRLWHNVIQGFSVDHCKWHVRFPGVLTEIKRERRLSEDEAEECQHLWWYNM